MQIDNLAFDPGDETYYTSPFHTFLLSYYQYFIDPINALVSMMPVEPGIAYKYTGDFIGLLNYLSIEPQYHWFIMYLNGLKSPADMNKKIITLTMPNSNGINEIEVIRNLYESID